MNRDDERSQSLARLVNPKQHECYKNSFHALSYLPDGSTYHEGYGILLKYGIPLEHGWCVLPDGLTVVDVTWLGIEASYHSVKSWTHEQLIGELARAKNPTLPLGWLDVLDTAEKHLAFLKSIMDDSK
jgi:hypothetical protein